MNRPTIASLVLLLLLLLPLVGACSDDNVTCACGDDRDCPADLVCESGMCVTPGALGTGGNHSTASGGGGPGSGGASTGGASGGATGSLFYSSTVEACHSVWRECCSSALETCDTFAATDQQGGDCEDVAACYGGCPLLASPEQDRCLASCENDWPWGSTAWEIIRQCVVNDGVGCSC